MIKFLLGLLGGLPSLLGKGLDYFSKKVDAGVETTRINTGAARDVTVTALQGAVEADRLVSAERTSAMAHPIWWVAWAAFVFPVALYHGSAFWVSTFPGLGWTVLKVPQGQADVAQTIVYSLFGLHATMTITDRVLSFWGRKKA